MSDILPEVYLARHGETDWSLSGQATGRTDIALTHRGERDGAHHKPGAIEVGGNGWNPPQLPQVCDALQQAAIDSDFRRFGNPQSESASPQVGISHC